MIDTRNQRKIVIGTFDVGTSQKNRNKNMFAKKDHRPVNKKENHKSNFLWQNLVIPMILASKSYCEPPPKENVSMMNKN